MNKQLNPDDRRILQLLKITPARLAELKQGLAPDHDQEPPIEVLQRLGISRLEYERREEGIRRQRAENWQICERVLLKSNVNLKHERERQREAELAFAEDKRRVAAKRAAENREKFFNQVA
jgi:hypothetical protein